MSTEAQAFVKEIPSKAEHFSDWYTAVVLKAELADYSPVRGLHGHPAIWLRAVGRHAALA